MSFDALLMLSGGKDSCALAVMLKEQGVDFMALTVDNGWVRDVAIQNARKVVKHLGIPHTIHRLAAGEYEKEIRPLVKEGMLVACTRCSILTLGFGSSFAKSIGAKKVYAGFTKYTAQAAGWDASVEKDSGGIILCNPFYKDYPLQRIRDICRELDLVLDPTKTNCELLPELLKETNRLKLPNHLLTEMNLLLKDGLITSEEFEYYKAFVCQM